MKTITAKIVMSALIAALACVATMIIRIPSPLKGYINLGDCIVLIAGWFLPPVYAFFAAGIGSALADIFSGYVNYAPATFIIKGLMAIIAFYGFKLLNKKLRPTLSRIISGISAELMMIAGYLVFESCLYGFVPSLVNVPANCIQGVAGLVCGIILMKIFDSSKILKDFK